jgi:hypothetical protein
LSPLRRDTAQFRILLHISAPPQLLPIHVRGAFKVNSAGGGVIVLPSICKIAGAVVFPNDGASQPHQSSIRITGEGASAAIEETLPTPTAGLDLTYNASVAKLDTRGVGLLEIDHVALIDSSGSDCAPFIPTTNTTLQIHDDLFQGTQSGTSACNPAIVLGGTQNKSADGTATSLF